MLKSGNSKFQKSPMYFAEHHWEENSGQVGKFLTAICLKRGVFEMFTPIGSHVNENEKKIIQNSNSK